MTEYACSLKGAAQLAFDNHTKDRAAFPTDFDEDNMILTGRCQAYTAILVLITGHRDPGRWQQSIDAIAPITVRRAGWEPRKETRR